MIIYGNFLNKKIININGFYRWGYLFFFVPTLICFILALDHGRNISLVATHLIIYYVILKFNKAKLKILEREIYTNINKLTLLILFLFFYLFLWKLDQELGLLFKEKKQQYLKAVYLQRS